MFPKLFVCWHSKKVKQISQHNSQMNQFMLIASSIARDSEKGDDLSFLFLEITTFSGNIRRSPTLLTIIHANIYSIFADKY